MYMVTKHVQRSCVHVRGGGVVSINSERKRKHFVTNRARITPRRKQGRRYDFHPSWRSVALLRSTPSTRPDTAPQNRSLLRKRANIAIVTYLPLRHVEDIVCGRRVSDAQDAGRISPLNQRSPPNARDRLHACPPTRTRLPTGLTRCGCDVMPPCACAPRHAPRPSASDVTHTCPTRRFSHPCVSCPAHTGAPCAFPAPVKEGTAANAASLARFALPAAALGTQRPFELEVSTPRPTPHPTHILPLIYRCITDSP